eukprot:3393506-Pyramimonas_sp.AAC.1
MMTTMDIMMDEFESADQFGVRDLDALQVGSMKPFDPNEAEHDITTDGGYQHLMNEVTRLKPTGALWVHLPHDTWLPWQQGHNRTSACANGNYLNKH